MKLADNVIEELWFAEEEPEEKSKEASESLAAKIAEVSGLKTFPVVAQKILMLLSNPGFRLVEITTVLEEDPSLAAGVLKMANSAFFFGSKAVSSIERAFVRLGNRAVREAVASVAAMEMFKDVQSGIGKRTRDHSAATAAMVQLLTRDFAPKYTDGIFLAGLMHDVGKLMLIESAEFNYDLLAEQGQMGPSATHVPEREQLGYDHAVLAAHMMNVWMFPDPVPRVVGWHHQPNRAFQEKDMGTMVSLLRIADRLEWLMHSEPEDYEADLDRLGDTDEAVFANITAEDLKERWHILYQVRADALVMFGG